MGIRGRISIHGQSDMFTFSLSVPAFVSQSQPSSRSKPLLLGVQAPAIWVLPVLLIAVLGLMLGSSIHQGHRNTLDQEYRLLEARAHTADAQLTGALRSIDLMLQRIIKDKMVDTFIKVSLPTADGPQSMTTQLWCCVAGCDGARVLL